MGNFADIYPSKTDSHMKNFLIIGLLCLFGAASYCPLQATPAAIPDKEEKEAVQQEIIKRVQARRFRIRITEAAGSYSTSGLEDGSVAIQDSLFICNLPYYGKMRGMVTDPSQLSLNFESPTIDYISSIIYDGTSKILFDAVKRNEHFVIYIEISPEGEAKVTVRSDQRTPASYSGEFEF